MYEMKLRFIYLLFSTLCTFCILYSYQIQLVYIVGKPFIEQQQTFIFLELTEAFYTFIRISSVLTLFLLFPLFLYNLWSFLIPSWYETERKWITWSFFVFFCLLVVEVLLIYSVLLPEIFNFFIGFEMAAGTRQCLSVEFSARIESYVHLLLRSFAFMIFLFQIPLLTVFLYSRKIFHVSSLYSNRKSLALFSLLLSAFIVPPDVLTQFIVAFFFFCVFEFLIFLGIFLDESDGSASFSLKKTQVHDFGNNTMQ
jgi:sec-independent protein translocase protein TatC